MVKLTLTFLKLQLPKHAKVVGFLEVWFRFTVDNYKEKQLNREKRKKEKLEF